MGNGSLKTFGAQQHLCQYFASPDALPFTPCMHAEIGGANGPQQLSALVLQFGPHLNPQHLSTALSKLAGFAVGAAGGGGLPAEDAEAVARTASRCAAVLRYKCDQLVDPLQVWGKCERAALVKCHRLISRARHVCRQHVPCMHLLHCP